METVTTSLVLILAVVVSGALSRIVPLPLPRPLFQIALGALVGLSSDLRFNLYPDIFFLLFLPPLLFLDGWRTPPEELYKDRVTIAELAFGLVIFTVVGAGLLIHWMLPSVPLAVAFALAAVISPTDPIAVSAIAQRVPIPARMMHILEGESMLNDASGLVCLRFAIAAALTGTFSPAQAALSFVWVAAGGIAVGVALTWATTRAKSWVSRRFGEEAGSQILISLLIPFGAYLIAEEIGCSGILAAVSAGVTMSFAEASEQEGGGTRIRQNTVWDMIEFAANGVIFVLLGEQLPRILGSAHGIVRMTGHENPWWLAVYVVGLTAGLALLRLLWVWTSLQLTILRTGRRRRDVPIRRLVFAMSFSGVRGAVTLAGVLTLPLFMNDGTPFPARDLAIFLAMGVIIVSLIAASLALPLLLKGLKMPLESWRDDQENAARIAAAEAAITALQQVQSQMSEGRRDADRYVTIASQIMDLYRERIARRSQEGEAAEVARQNDAIEREMRLAAIRAERKEVFRRVRRRMLGSDTARKIIRELDLLEDRHSA